MLGLLVLALALSMDAFAASVSQGATAQPRKRGAVPIALAFGVAQGVMPLIGYWLSATFSRSFEAIDHWIALGLLGFVGGRMIYQAYLSEAKPEPKRLVGLPLLMASVATSIDAAAAGVTLPIFEQPLLTASLLIGTITAVLCYAGVLIGRAMGRQLGRWADIVGGVLLIGLGLNIFIQHHFFGA